jgi:hypothetical protein
MKPKLERAHDQEKGKPADAGEALKRKREAIDRLLDMADERKLNDIYNFILHIL